MRATIIGAGRIALGLAAEQLHQSGYEVTVLGRGHVAAALQHARVVEVELTDGWTMERFLVPGAYRRPGGSSRSCAGRVHR